ncbi:unnamed protein product [Brassicogethes aeneus]|uniref:Hermansky-Pudlak syndrome 1 protein homolog n=1 Tax=Brassicogethes aeneus TaxID=1431903 RepID=A0A9P0B1W0_BRAAE|nr:unnamed protein product [Brassicogethes aeneus]
MNCLLIFDHLNDIIYTKYNKEFVEHINEFAVAQCLQEEVSQEKIDENIIVQIFSPIITSHRIMSCQFGNSYTSIKCLDGLDIHFDQYMGYLFIAIDNSSRIRRYLNVCITIARYLCGPDVYQLKQQESKAELASNLIDSWVYLHKNDQAVLIEAVEQLIVNSDLSMATLKALQESVDYLAPQIDCNKIHALVLVQNKFLSLYSSQNAKELSATDILFSIILNHCATQGLEKLRDLYSYKILLAGPELHPKCLPHVVHIVPIIDGVNLIYLLEVGNTAIASSLYETFSYLHTMQLLQSQREKSVLQPAFENLELAIKKLNDSLKKIKNSPFESAHKQIMKKWDVIKKKYQEFFKNASDEALLRAETLILAFLENLNHLLKLTSLDEGINTGNFVKLASKTVKTSLANYNEFFKVKSIKNFSLGSRYTRYSLTINKYLEEFPGLVHFIYIDRTSHRLTSPTLDLTVDNMTNKKIFFMINFGRNHIMEGTLSLMWKDTSFNYGYFVWFEDNTGAPIKPTVLPSNTTSLPGILAEDFYLKLKESCFPKTSPGKIKCYELFCVHLGLVTASCVLEQTRRLSATIWELRGHPSHPIDLL